MDMPVCNLSRRSYIEASQKLYNSFPYLRHGDILSYTFAGAIAELIYVNTL